MRLFTDASRMYAPLLRLLPLLFNADSMKTFVTNLNKSCCAHVGGAAAVITTAAFCAVQLLVRHDQSQLFGVFGGYGHRVCSW